MKRKKCAICGIKKSLTNFSPSKNGSMGLSYACKPCIVDAYYTKRKASGVCVRCKEKKPMATESHCVDCRPIVLTINKQSYTKQKNIVLDHYGPKCICCGEEHREFLEIDHKLGDGKKHRVKLKTDSANRYIIKHNFPDAFQVLCSNCNFYKSNINRPCPHKVGSKRNTEFIWLQSRIDGHLKIAGGPDGSVVTDTPEYQLLRINMLRLKAFNAYGGPHCACCNETTSEFLSLDHIDGGGNKHNREIGRNLYHWLHKNNYPPGFRVLCYNCNFSLSRHGHCPHNNPAVKAPVKTTV